MLFNEIKFVEDYRKFKKDETIQFDDNLTIISGDNGSGKSTLIGCIRNMFDSSWSYSYNMDNNDKIIFSNDFNCNNKKVFFLDSCKDVNVTGAGLDSEHKTMEDMILSVKGIKQSSGESLIYQIVHLLNNAKDADLVIIDEPEKGLSIKIQLLLSNVISKFCLENINTQVIITTHSEIMLNLKDTIWSTTHKKKMKTDEYISWLYSSS